MKKLIVLLMAAAASFTAFAQKDPFVGFYQGEVVGAKKYPLRHDPDVFAEIFRANDSYRIKILSGIMGRADEHYVADNLKASGSEILLDSKSGSGSISVESGKITPNTITIKGKHGGDNINIAFKRMNIVSPTMGAKPPAGAVVLFDGKDTSKWGMGDKPSDDINWEVKDGEMTIKVGAVKADGKKRNSTITTREGFDAFKMHLEFKMPSEFHKNAGQGRGNSGVIVGPYEIQLLESFGSPGLWDQCGAVYRQVPPQVNACLEPEVWQTYDITFKPAKYDGDKLVSLPTFTVYQNGVCVQRDTPVLYETSKSARMCKNYKHPVSDFKIKLQDHDHKLVFRNIWLEKL